MKTLLSWTAVVLSTATLLAAAEPSAAVKDEVMQAETAWKDAVIKGDRAALEKLVSDEVTYTHSSSETQTKEQFIRSATGGSTVYKEISFDNTHMRQYGSTVIITHNATITTVQTGTSHLYLTEVWAKEKGHWQMVLRQATKIPPPK